MKKCAKCGKQSETKRHLWAGGPNGNRMYDLCERCIELISKLHNSKVS